MLINCLKCKQDTGSIDSIVLKTKNVRTMLPSKCAISASKKSSFMKEQEAKGLLNSLGPKTLLNKILLLGDILF